jgi:DNA replication and repair protein RecF
MAVSRLLLTDFRNHREALIEPDADFILLSGPNGAGKTNILEAVSLLSPGRGLRQVAVSEMARSDGPGSFAIAARLDDGTEVGTGTSPASPDRRQVRINGAAASVNSLSERLSVLWLTPAMDRLFTDTAGGRRRFLDRLTLALHPAHATHSARYEAAMRARNKLLADPASPDEAWLSAVESQMAEHGAVLAETRRLTVDALNEAIASSADSEFPLAALALEGWSGGDLAGSLRAGRGVDASAGRTLQGPHRQDLNVTHVAKGQPAARSSTGEQKALLLGIVLAHAELVASARAKRPILLLDEVAAHLDPDRRRALLRRLGGRGQVWMTATEPDIFGPSLSGHRIQLPLIP